MHMKERIKRIERSCPRDLIAFFLFLIDILNQNGPKLKNNFGVNIWNREALREHILSLLLA